MVYVSDGKPREDEASCIDLSLEIGIPAYEAPGSLGYYPTYAKISPNQRANYLRWLSSGRVDPLSDIGYAFLFFYGLERRLLLERQRPKSHREGGRSASRDLHDLRFFRRLSQPLLGIHAGTSRNRDAQG